MASGVGGGPPTVVNGVVYVSGDKLYAFNATSGAPMWSATTGAGGGPPAVASGVVYVTGDKLYAFDATTGAQRWSAAIGVGGSSPAVANGVVYVNRDKVYAFDAASGAPRWSAAIGVGGSAPAVANGVVYVTGDKVYALNATNGSTLWSATIDWTRFTGGSPRSRTASSTPATVRRGLFALDATTGAELGGRRVAVQPGRGRVLYVSGGNLQAYSLRPATALLSISPAFPEQSSYGPSRDVVRDHECRIEDYHPLTNSIVGPDAAHFAPLTDGCAGSRLLPGFSCTMRAFFAPKSSGPKHARLTSTADSGGTVSAMLAGTGPPFIVSPFSKNFGNPVRRFNITASFTVTNFGDDPVGPITIPSPFKRVQDPEQRVCRPDDGRGDRMLRHGQVRTDCRAVATAGRSCIRAGSYETRVSSSVEMDSGRSHAPQAGPGPEEQYRLATLKATARSEVSERHWQ